MSESPYNPETSRPEEGSSKFVKRQVREGLVKYVFKDLAVGIDTRGKNYTELPEVHFGANIDDRKLAFRQEAKGEEVTMKYVMECVVIAMEDAGCSEAWFYPNDKDTRESAREALVAKLLGHNPEMTEGEIEQEVEKQRGEARLRLFRRYADVRPATPKGYIIKI